MFVPLYVRILVGFLHFGLAGATADSFSGFTTTSVNENDDGVVNLWTVTATCYPKRLEADGNYTDLIVPCESCYISSNPQSGLFEMSGNTLRKKACGATSCGTCLSCSGACSAASGCTTAGQSYTVQITCHTNSNSQDDFGMASYTMTVSAESPTLSLSLATPLSANNGMSNGDVLTTATATSGLTIEWEENVSVANSYLLATPSLFALNTGTGAVKVNADPSNEYSYDYSMRVCVYSRRQTQCKTTIINFSGCFQRPTCNDQTDTFVNDTHGIGEQLFSMSVPVPSAHFSSISNIWQGLAFSEVSSTLGVTYVHPTTGSITTTGNITVHPDYPSVTHETVVEIGNSESCSYVSTCTMTFTVFFTNWPIVINNSVTTTSIHEDVDARTTLFNIDAPDGNDPAQDNVTCTLSTANTDLFEIVDDGLHNQDSYSIVKKVCTDAGCGFLCDLNIGCLNWNLTSSYDMDVTCSDGYGSSDTKTFTVNVNRNEIFTWRNLPMTITVNSDAVAQWDVLFSILYTDAEDETLSYNYSVSPAQPSPPLFSFDSEGNYYNRAANVTSLMYQWDLTNTSYTVFICGKDRRNYKCEDLTIDIREYCGPTPTCTTDSTSVTDQFTVGASLLTITVPSAGSFSGLSFAIATDHLELFDVDSNSGEITSKAALSVTSPPDSTQYTIVGIVYDTEACEYSTCDLTVKVNFTNFDISIDNMNGVSESIHEDVTSAVTLLTVATSDSNTDDSVNCTVDEANSVPANNGKFQTEETGTNSGVFRIVSIDGPGFDYDVEQTYVIAVTCSDRYGSSDSGNMTVTILENQPPNMTNLDNTTIVSVDPLTTFSGTTLFTLETSDAENDALTYNCSVDNSWVPLECLTDGVVSLRRNVIIPDENGTLYNITMCIYEPVHSHELCAELQVNFTTSKTHPVLDNLPDTVYVAEDASVGDIIFNVTVQDPDAGETHTFSLVSISPEESTQKFSLDTSTGVITLTSALDYETCDSYNVTVSVTDQYLAGQEDKTLTVNVNNTNEAPTLVVYGTSFNTTEGTTGREIGVLNFTCTDPDISEGLTFAIISGTYMNHFGLNGVSGSLTHALEWDLESGSSFPDSTEIVVSCYDDEGLSSTATLTVSIAAVNEFAPVLNTVAESITIYSNQTIHEPLFTITATDADYGHDGNFSYNIVGMGNGATYFTMTDDGQLRLADYITWTYNFTFEFTIVVSDNESDPLTSSVDVSVTYIAPNTTTEPTRPSYCLLCRTEGIVVVSALGIEALLICACFVHICKRMKAYSIFLDNTPTSIGVRNRDGNAPDLNDDDEQELKDLTGTEDDEPNSLYRPRSECMNRAIPDRQPPPAFNYYPDPPSPPPPPVYEDPSIDLSDIPEPVVSPSGVIPTAAAPKHIPRRGIRTIAELAHATRATPPRRLPQLFQDDPPAPSPKVQRVPPPAGSGPMFSGSNTQPHHPDIPQEDFDQRSVLISPYYNTEVNSPPRSAGTRYPSPVWEPPGHSGVSRLGQQSTGLDF